MCTTASASYQIAITIQTVVTEDPYIISASRKMVGRNLFLISCLAVMAAAPATASVFLPYDVKAASYRGSKFAKPYQNDFSKRELTRLRQSCATNGAAMAIPGYGLGEQIFVGGFMNFLSIYNLVITARILLSWFPQAQGIGILQPVYQITDPYLNLFRGLIPPVFGLDLSPILAFFLLNVLTNATAAVGAEITPEMRKKMSKKYSPFAKKRNDLVAFAP
mmetsp:Transcript_52369/g.150924  ORF Transcript_52369/g.150924 Transcript_52369/m.150924 type:complete len:220 (+) Transcript_52369:74-733(+)